MNEGKLYSLMLYAVALSTEMGGVGNRELDLLAEGINGTPPDSSDKGKAIKWLEKYGYITSKWWKYKLTVAGYAIFRSATHETQEMAIVWKNLERIINDKILLHSTP
jgi:hypothetical protein